MPVVAAIAAAPLARPVLLGLLDKGVVASAMQGVSLRLGVLVAALMALHTYTDLVRSPDRKVLDAHPVDARVLLRAIAWRTAIQRSYLPVVAAILLLPAWPTAGWQAWFGATAVVTGAWLGALGVGFATHLGAVHVGLSDRYAAILDTLRGDNPRMQAALIYAPGAVLAVMGIVIDFAANGLARALVGQPVGWLFVGLPPLVGWVGWTAAGPLAERYYVRATALLSEVDGMVASARTGKAEEDTSVYLEWLARGRRELIRQLRQGWRAHRTWATGAWGLGMLGFLAAWSRDPDVAGRLLSVVGGCVALFAFVPTRLALGDPLWLDEALGVSRMQVARARASVAFLYAQGAVIPPLLAGSIRHGSVVLAPILAAEAMGVLLIGIATFLAHTQRDRAAWWVGPLALLAWASLTALGTDGLPFLDNLHPISPP